MYYSISGICPRTDIDMGRHGFSIHLHPKFKEQVAKSGITEKNVQDAIKNMGRYWLDACGYSAMYDPDNNGFGANPKQKLGPKAQSLYEPGYDLRISWGEWEIGRAHV